MPETKLQTKNDQYRLCIGLSIFLLKFSRFLNLVLSFFSLKQTTQFWGIAYDSLSKQPLDPVIVKLMYVDGREVETCITDIAGRYGFLARPGKFKIYARKTNYLFPSRYSPGDSDGIYENLYHGEFFSLHEDYEVVAPNIPMDPVGTDWNQKAKLSVINKSPYLKHFFKMLIGVLFSFGFILDIVLIFKTFPATPVIFFVVAAVYFALLVLSLFLPETRLWGKVKGKISLARGQQLFLELRNIKFPEISFGKTMVKEDGKFLLRASKGKYLLSVSKIDSSKKTQILGTLNVVIGNNGVLNSTIIISSV